MTYKTPGRPARRRATRYATAAALAGLSASAFAGTAEARPIPPDEPTPSWLLSHPGCPACGAALDQVQWIDPAASLGPATQIPLQVSAVLHGRPAAGATVFLRAAFAGKGASARVGDLPLGSVARPFALDAKGRLTVLYRTADQLPSIGLDAVTVADDPKGTGATTVSYNYDKPVAYSFAPSPVAPPGSPSKGQSAGAGLVALDPAGTPVAGALVADWDEGDGQCGVWLGSVLRHHGPVGPTASPTWAFTSPSGSVGFTFTANGAAGGSDILVVEDSPNAPMLGAKTSYQC